MLATWGYRYLFSVSSEESNFYPPAKKFKAMVLLAPPLIIGLCMCCRSRMTHTGVSQKDPTAKMTDKAKEEFYELIKQGVTHVSSDSSWRHGYFHKTRQSKNLPKPKVLAKATKCKLTGTVWEFVYISNCTSIFQLKPLKRFTQESQGIQWELTLWIGSWT